MRLLGCALVLGCAWPMSVFGAPPAEGVAAPTVLDYGRFGAVSVYRPSGAAKDLVLFLSGEDGGGLNARAMARLLGGRGAIVAAIDVPHYLHELERASEKCVSAAGDFENLSHFLQSTLGLASYLPPTLIGYSAGAALAYATLAQSPEGTFKGALSAGFCPELDLAKPLCRGLGLPVGARADATGLTKGVTLPPATALAGPFIALAGDADAACPAAAVRAFVAKLPNGEVVALPQVDHEYSSEAKWAPQFEAAYARLTSARAADDAAALPAPVADLPLIVVPAAPGGGSAWFGVFLSGDGGWVGLDKGVSAALAAAHIPIVGWDSLKYFWTPRTPQGAAQDLDRVLRHYARAWGKSHAVLIGYSQGADTMPFMVNGLPPATRAMVGLTTLLGIEKRAHFEFHFANWLDAGAGGLPIAPELARWSGAPYLCLYGEEDSAAACAQVSGADGLVVRMPGGHHFGGDYQKIAAEILRQLPTP